MELTKEEQITRDQLEMSAKILHNAYRSANDLGVGHHVFICAMIDMIAFGAAVDQNPKKLLKKYKETFNMAFDRHVYLNKSRKP